MDQTYTMPEQPKKSGHNLVKLGLILFCVSLCLTVNSVTVGFISDEWTSPLVTVCCSLVFFTISLLSMYGESGDNGHKKRILFACVGFTIVGFAATVIGSVFNINTWRKFDVICKANLENPNSTFEEAVFLNNATQDSMQFKNNLTMESVAFENNSTMENDAFEMNSTMENDETMQTTMVYEYMDEVNNSTLKIDDVWFCKDRRTGLFLLLVGLLICNEIISMGLAYVIIVTRIRQGNYVSAVAV